MALTLLGHGIEMFPLERCCIPCDGGGKVVSDAIALGSCQNAARSGLDLMKRRLRWETVIGEECEDLRGLGDVFMPLRAPVIHAFLRRLLRGLMGVPDAIHQTVDEMVRHLWIAVIDNTAHRDRYDPLVQLLQPEDGVIRDQGGVVCDAFLGNLQRRQQPVRQRVHVRNLRTATDCALALTGAAIARLPLELGHCLESRRIVHQTLSVCHVSRAQGVGEDGCQALVCLRAGLADRLVQEGVAGSANPLFRHVMHEFPEAIQGWYGNRGRLPGLGRYSRRLGSIAWAVTQEGKPQVLLSQPRHLGAVKVIEWHVGIIVGLDLPGIL